MMRTYGVSGHTICFGVFGLGCLQLAHAVLPRHRTMVCMHKDQEPAKRNLAQGQGNTSPNC